MTMEMENHSPQVRQLDTGIGQAGGLKQRQQVGSCWPGRSSVTAIPPFHRLDLLRWSVTLSRRMDETEVQILCTLI